ncbi:MAG: virulence factor [Actinomycetota bacterium]
MDPVLTVIRWRDIPMQIVARGHDGSSARRLLPDRFQEAVDASAMVDGLIGSDDYTAQMVIDRRSCGEDLEAEVQAEADRLETEWTDEVLRLAIRAGGSKGGADVAGETAAARPSDRDA